MLTLKRPFEGPNMKALMANICKGSYHPIGAHYSKEVCFRQWWHMDV